MHDKTNGYAVDVIENEDIGYAVIDYCDGDTFKDPQTRTYWNEAGAALERLRAYLAAETGRDVQ